VHWKKNNGLIVLALLLQSFSIKPVIMTRLENFCLFAPVLKQIRFNIPCILNLYSKYPIQTQVKFVNRSLVQFRFEIAIRHRAKLKLPFLLRYAFI